MSPSEADRIHTLDDFLELLAGLAEQGCEAVVIGGLAVGVYAHLLGETSLSADLDLYSDRTTLDAILLWARRHGAVIRKLPQVRNVPVAFIEWHGKEVNVLTSSSGLPDYQSVLRSARVVRVKMQSVLVADPYDLLSNKLTIKRDKDMPHIEILLRFIEEEIVSDFTDKTDPRERLASARRLLRATRARSLPTSLASRLVPLARTDVDFRFLMNHVPNPGLADELQRHVPPEVTEELRAIRRSRRWPKP